jgi:putative MATE family efflux protein
MPQHKPLLERGFWSVTWPIMLDVSLGMILTFTDVLFLGRISDSVAAAIGGILPILLLAEAMYFPLGQGCTGVLGRQLGAGRSDLLGTSYGVCILLAGALGLLLATLVAAVHGHIGTWLGYTPALRVHASQYLLAIAAGFFFLTMYRVMASLMRCHGNTRWAMVGAIGVLVINVVLNLLLSGGVAALGLSGVQGVALSTVSASCAGMCWMLYGVFTRLPARPAWPASFAAFRALAQPILKIALPASTEPLNFNLSQVAVMTMIVPFGAVALSTRSYVQASLTVVIVLELAIAIGTQIFVAHMVGARLYDLANRLLHRNIAQAFAFGTVVNLCLFLGAAQVLSLFTNDRRVVEMAMSLFLISLFWEPAKSVNLVTGFSLRAVGDARFSSYTGISLWLLACPLAYLLGVVCGFGLPGIWAALAIDENVRAILHYRRWRGNRWRAGHEPTAGTPGAKPAFIQPTVQKG